MNEVSTIVPTAKSESVSYVVQYYIEKLDKWEDTAPVNTYDEVMEKVKRLNIFIKHEKYRIIKRTIIDEVIQ